jgi:hypothetical protein
LSTYFFEPPKAPVRQELQMPKPVPLDWMNWQVDVRAANSEPGSGGIFSELGVVLDKVPLINGTLTGP